MRVRGFKLPAPGRSQSGSRRETPCRLRMLFCHTFSCSSSIFPALVCWRLITATHAFTKGMNAWGDSPCKTVERRGGAPHNGQITFTVTIPAPPAPDPALVCPNGNWSVSLLSLTFVGVVVHLQQNGVDILTGDLGTIDP